MPLDGDGVRGARHKRDIHNTRIIDSDPKSNSAAVSSQVTRTSKLTFDFTFTWRAMKSCEYFLHLSLQRDMKVWGFRRAVICSAGGRACRYRATPPSGLLPFHASRPPETTFPPAQRQEAAVWYVPKAASTKRSFVGSRDDHFLSPHKIQTRLMWQESSFSSSPSFSWRRKAETW